jgi:hypothetical protein
MIGSISSSNRRACVKLDQRCRFFFVQVQILNRQVCYVYFRSKSIVLPTCDVCSALCAGSKMLTKSVERSK